LAKPSFDVPAITLGIIFRQKWPDATRRKKMSAESSSFDQRGSSTKSTAADARGFPSHQIDAAATSWPQ
jgi:hypothetical protein